MIRIAPALGATERRAAEMRPSLCLDEAAFRSFYDATAPGLRAYLARTSGDDALADDLTQEAYVRFLRSDFEAESTAHRRNYLYRIATNLLRDHLRRRRRRPEEPLDEGQPAPASGRRVDRRDLERLFAELRLRDRQMLWLAYVEGRTHQEIAVLLGLREASLRPMLFRARGRMAALCQASGFAPASRPPAPETTPSEG